MVEGRRHEPRAQVEQAQQVALHRRPGVLGLLLLQLIGIAVPSMRGVENGQPHWPVLHMRPRGRWNRKLRDRVLRPAASRLTATGSPHTPS